MLKKKHSLNMVGSKTFVCDQICAEIFCENTNYRLPIPVEKRVVIALWCLATPAEYRIIGHLFHVSRCTFM